MTSKGFILFLFACGFSQILCTRKPCDFADNSCVSESSKSEFAKLTKGIPSIGIESSDPVYVPLIEQRLQSIHYTFRNAYLVGFSNCYMHDFHFYNNKSNGVAYVICPRLVIESEYELVGYLGYLYVEGKGFCRIVHDNIHIGFYDDIKHNIYHGKGYINITDYLLGIDVKERVTYEFQNLYQGNKEFSDSANIYANQNWRVLKDSFQLPLLYPFMDKIIVSLNKYLAKTPADEVFSRFE